MYYNQFFNPKKEPYASNKKLRQAAWHAIDRDGLVRAIGFGVAKPYKYPFWTTSALGYDESLPYYNFDLPKAKQLMAEAGFEKGLDITIKVINRTVEIQKAEALKSMFDAIGLRTTVDVLERLAWTSAIPAYNYDMAMNRPSTFADTDLQRQYLLCGGSQNWASYCNPELDKCMLEGKSVYDEAKRAEIYKRCQRILYEDAASGTTFFVPGNVVYHKKVKGLHTQFNAFKVDAREAWVD